MSFFLFVDLSDPSPWGWNHIKAYAGTEALGLAAVL